MNLQHLDHTRIWHPFTQHATALTPWMIERAQGAYLYTNEGKPLLDAISSWWVTLHGHCHPHLVDALTRQASQLDQVIFAGMTHPKAVELADILLRATQERGFSFQRAFYSDNGSTAVEVALKMAVQWFALGGQPQRTKFITLEGAYHGDTFGAMSVSDRGVFTSYFHPMLFPADALPVPLWNDPASCQRALECMEELLKDADSYAGFIYEPLVQGVAGMVMQDRKTIDTLIGMARARGLLAIADEVMTGFYRTGTLFAGDTLRNKPDLMCLAKGITGGTLPLSVTLASEELFARFSSPQKAKAFFHGHSYTANPLACAVALASWDVLMNPGTQEQIQEIGESHFQFAKKLQTSTHRDLFQDVRCQGTILAVEFVPSGEGGYLNGLAEKVLRYFPEKGVLLRPLGNVLYLLPPYCVKSEDLNLAYQAIEEFCRDLSH